jgi:hypothetical protein
VPPGLIFLLIKTKITSYEELAQTTFYFDPSGYWVFVRQDLVSDPAGYEPSYEDDLFAPFYPDASQRVLLLDHPDRLGPLVMKTEVLLRLARERKGQNLLWEEWQVHTTRVSFGVAIERLWVCGPRVLCVHSTKDRQTLIDVYDFSAQASARYSGTIEGKMAERFVPNATQILPWKVWEIAIPYGSHDKITFILVKIFPAPRTRLKLTCFVLEFWRFFKKYDAGLELCVIFVRQVIFGVGS